MHYHMFSIELIVFSLLLAIFYKVRAMKPDWFVLINGLSVFLPPEEKDLEELKKEREKIVKPQNKFQKNKSPSVHLFY